MKLAQNLPCRTIVMLAQQTRDRNVCGTTVKERSQGRLDIATSLVPHMRAVRVAVAYTIRIRVDQVVLMVDADSPALSSNARCDKTAAVDGYGL
jgi:hypothetical protein